MNIRNICYRNSLVVSVLSLERHCSQRHVNTPNLSGVTHIGTAAFFAVPVDLLVGKKVCYGYGGKYYLAASVPAVCCLRTYFILKPN